ncbi:hypothetical protein GO986_17835 [Deinococcus sp. HMF7620]|uniref:RNA polymerase sigma-70 region 2 domain-containing protein n=1 Tax=Deinococcus arboris TaxID=2682977 RepID=A0A7C9LWU1_9DEIO|nr:hypothetical protein [Deinococcus arboris]MVN88600.1 hypothetical protein [Deinococcus arboris]
MPVSHPPSPETDALERLVASNGQELAECVRTFGPVLYRLAQHEGLPDPEEATYLALSRVQVHCESWTRSGLPARVWVLGVARQLYRGLTHHRDLQEG